MSLGCLAPASRSVVVWLVLMLEMNVLRASRIARPFVPTNTSAQTWRYSTPSPNWAEFRSSFTNQPMMDRRIQNTHQGRRHGEWTRKKQQQKGQDPKYKKYKVQNDKVLGRTQVPQHAATGVTIKVRLSVQPFAGKTRGIISTTLATVNNIPESLRSSLSPARAENCVTLPPQCRSPLAVSPVSCEQPAASS